jgi:hypothetical protein
MRTICSSLALSALAATLLVCAGPARAIDDLDVTVGVKGWASTWDTWRPQNVFYSTGPTQVSEPVDSGTRFAVTPSLSLRWKRLLLSGSYLAPETYPLNGALDTSSLAGRRKELDANGGYYVLPGLALLVGYKEIYQDYGVGTFKWKGPTVGAAASASLGPHWAIYGVYGYGLLKLHTPPGSADINGTTSFDATYNLGELGFAYAFTISKVLKAMRVTVGYRAQILRTRGYALENRGSSPDEHDNTQGPTIGLSGTF